ncbi:helix-turn-helix domain-containing protein [Candidatus Woesearchaeota archaeon]|nr:helix-turn-helix domain-containing protein [Candidatus Woesearchaeota archaeon]
MIIISEKSGVKLQDGVVYTRFGVSTVNLNTLKRAIDHKLPFIISKKSGLTAEILGKKLHNLRESMQMSARSLARKIQVSPRMISKYENEDSEISLNRAKKLYEIIGSAVFKEINIFESLHNQIEPERETNLTRKFHELGFSTTETKKTPFDLIAKSQREIILTRVGDKIDNELLLISKLMGTDDLVIFKKKKPKNIPALTKEEFMEIEKPNELIKVVKEF